MEIEATLAEQTVPQNPRPRIWPPFFALFVALLIAVGGQIVVVVAVAVIEMSRGSDPQSLQEELPRLLSTPFMFILMASIAQIAFAFVTLIPAKYSGESITQRLGLSPPKPSGIVYPLTMLGSLLPLGLGLSLAIWIAEYIPPDPTVELLFENMTIASSIPFVLFIAFAPGICEELLFRGYMQRRLLQRIHPFWAIGITSVVFGLVHATPHAIAAAFPMGVWIGIVAWKADSILPAIACHAFINGSLNAWRSIALFGEIPESTQNICNNTFLGIGAVCFVAVIVLWLRQAAGATSKSSSAAQSPELPSDRL